jgi:glycosyltransferase involved in cell wall biosynthesis
VLRARLGIPAEAVMLMSVGSLIPRKRMDFIVKALGPVLRTAKNAWVLVAGDGPESSALESLARREVSDGRIRFLGLRDDVRDLLAAADVCVHASVAEACTYAVTESMSAGIPAVVTEAGAHREQIEDGCSGYVLGCDDSAGFAARVAELVNDPARRRSMGERALERWRQHFQVEAQAAAYHALYRRVSAGGEKIETSRG